MGPDYGGINHHLPFIRIIQQYLKNLFPDTRAGLAGVALLDAPPFAMLFRKEVPFRPVAQNPENPIHKQADSFRGYPHRLRQARQDSFNLFPLPIADLSPLIPSTTLA